MVLFLSSAELAHCQAAEIFVSPQGNDAHAGTKARPFKSLEKARDVARELNRDGKVVVWLRGGVYERAKAFTLTAKDSGSTKRPVVYRGFPGEEARIVGGKVVTEWNPVSDKAILARLAREARGKVVQADLKALGVTDYGQVKGGGLELFFQDKPMTLSRWPNEGFIKITGLVEPDTVNVRGKKGSKTGKFMYPGDRPKRWAGEPDPWVHGSWFWDWSDQRHAIQSIDTSKRIISVKPPYHGYGYRVGQWFYALNLLAELDQPGEWYLDRESGVLYFWPPDKIGHGDAIVSVIPDLVTLKNVSHVTFRGLTFEACRGTAVTIWGGTQNRVAGCTLRNLGSYAVRIGRGAAVSGVLGCDIYETGDGGIALSGGDRKTLTPAGLYADNNHIHHYGRLNRMYKAAIHLSGVGNRATHNLIHDAPHMAIGFGGNDHLIEFNEIYNVCEESNDAGAMYAGRDWTMRGTVIRHNYLHDISGFRGRGCVGVYLDDMFCGTKIYGNVFYKVTRAAFIGGGRDCSVENNLFVDCPKAMHVDARAMGWAKYHVKTTMTKRLKAMPYKSELWRKRYPKLVNILDDEPAAPKGNIVTRNIFVGKNWNDINKQARKYVTPVCNVETEGDPKFVAAAVDCWFKPESNMSRVFKQVLGFKPIPFEKIGLYTCDERPTLPPSTPSVHPGACGFVGSQTVTLATRTTGGSIHYTVDGSVPTRQSPRTTGPILLTDSVTVRAAAFTGNAKTGCRSSVVSARYEAMHLNADGGVPLSRLPMLSHAGYCEPKRDSNMEGDLIVLGGKTYLRGLLLHPKETPNRGCAHAEFAMTGGLAAAKRFKATVGVDARVDKRGSVAFIVEGRRAGVWKKLYKSPVMKGGKPPVDIDVDVHGCDRLRLVVTDGGDNIHSDHAAWGNARFTAQ